MAVVSVRIISWMARRISRQTIIYLIFKLILAHSYHFIYNTYKCCIGVSVTITYELWPEYWWSGIWGSYIIEEEEWILKLFNLMNQYNYFAQNVKLLSKCTSNNIGDMQPKIVYFMKKNHFKGCIVLYLLARIFTGSFLFLGNYW